MELRLLLIVGDGVEQRAQRLALLGGAVEVELLLDAVLVPELAGQVGEAGQDPIPGQEDRAILLSGLDVGNVGPGS